MPIVLGLFCGLPLTLGLVAQYLCCRLPKGWGWKLLPPGVGLLFVGVSTWIRLENWTSQANALSQLMLFPLLPAVWFFLGCWFGLRLWRKRWGPKVIDAQNDSKHQGR